MEEGHRSLLQTTEENLRPDDRNINKMIGIKKEEVTSPSLRVSRVDPGGLAGDSLA